MSNKETWWTRNRKKVINAVMLGFLIGIAGIPGVTAMTMFKISMWLLGIGAAIVLVRWSMDVAHMMQQIHAIVEARERKVIDV